MSIDVLKARYASMSIAQLKNARDSITKRLYYYNHTVPDPSKAKALSAEAKVILAMIYKQSGSERKYLEFLSIAGNLLKPAEDAIASAKATVSGVLDSVSSSAKMIALFVAVVGLGFVILKK